MSFPAFEHYKESGWSWIGAVPSHWDVRRMKTLFSRTTRPVEKGDKIVTAFRDGQVTLRENRREEGFTNALQEIGYQGVRRGDLVIHAMDGFAGAIGVSDSDGKSTPVYTVCVAKPEANPRYYAALLRHMALSGFVSSLAKGIRERSTDFRWADASVLALPHPPLDEQAAIVAFLDRETGKIDALVEAQTRLIELLKEKRQAVISHAVTKGLDPAAPMKDSGVEWLGQVPAHWEVTAIKRFFNSLDGRRIPLSSEERGQRSGPYPYYGASGVIDTVDDFLFDEELVLVSEDGANLVNRSTPIAFVASGRYWVNNHAHVLRPVKGNSVFWAARIEAIDLMPFVTGSAQPKLTADALFNLVVAVPPTGEERSAIEQHIINCRASLEPLVVQAKAAIALLQERRAALISAAVTGKIDVRGLALEQAEAA